jgi:hypothetical protein
LWILLFERGGRPVLFRVSRLNRHT